jgi:heme exporter protein A
MRLAVEGLSVARGGRVVLSGISFAVGAGEALLLTGPNGSGKTTLLRTIAGFLRPEAGRIAIEGVADDAGASDRMHLVGHLNGIKASLTVAENLTFWGRFLGGSATGGLARLNLDSLAHIPAGYLSAGQKRRLGLARLLAAPRPIWLLDEPTVSLDAASVEVLAGLVQEHVAGGGIAIAATHVPLGIAAREMRLGGGAA